MNDKSEFLYCGFIQKVLAIEPKKLDAILGSKINPKTFELDFPQRQENDRPYELTESGVAVINISGVLTGGLVHLYYKTFYKNLEESFTSALNDSGVEAILLNVDSPGGEAGGMFDLSDTIFNARGQKPIWAIANEEAFSAAYSLTSAADKIYLTRTAGVGSVGVIAVHVDASKMNENFGLNYSLFRGGKFKAEGNSVEPLTPHAQESIQDEVNRIYTMFVEQVSRNRGISIDSVQATEASLYFGENALAVGFADNVGNFKEVLTDLENLITKKTQRTFIMADKIEKTKNESSNVKNSAVENTVEPVVGNEQEKPVASNSTDVSGKESERESGQDYTAGDITKAEQRGKDQALVEIKEIVDACNLAGKPNRATAFISDGVTPVQVRERLLSESANESDSYEIDNHHDSSVGLVDDEKTKIDTHAIYQNRNVQDAVQV